MRRRPPFFYGLAIPLLMAAQTAYAAPWKNHQFTVSNQAAMPIDGLEFRVPGSSTSTGNLVVKSPIQPGTSLIITLPQDAPCVLDGQITFSNGAKLVLTGQNSCDEKASYLFARSPIVAPPVANTTIPSVVEANTRPPAKPVQRRTKPAKPYEIQLGTFPDRDAARSAWANISQTQRAVLPPATEAAYSTASGASGQTVRLRLGPFELGDAYMLCGALIHKGQACWVTRAPSGPNG